MIISHQHKYVFIEVPHTGSTAISKELREHYDGELILDKHSNYSEFLSTANKEEKKYFVFATVRNPLDYIATLFYKFKTNHNGMYKDPSQFQRNGGWLSDDHLVKFDFVQKNPDFNLFFQHFYNSIYNNWVLLGHKRFDFILRFENLQNDFKTVLELMGIKPIRDLPVVNKTDRKADYLEGYTPDSQAHAVKYFGPFMNKWGYRIPENWDFNTIPLTSRIRYNSSEHMINFLSSYISLSPKNPFLQKCNKLYKTLSR